MLAQSSAAGHRPVKPVIEFGHEGGNLRPYRIGISKTGRVEILMGTPSLRVAKLSADEVRTLLHNASDRRFWKRPGDNKRPRLPDLGFVFVKVRDSRGKIIEHRGAQTGPLGEFYSILSKLVLAN